MLRGSLRSHLSMRICRERITHTSLPPKAGFDPGPVQSFEANDHELARTPFIRPPGPVEIAVEPRAHRLDQKPARRALDRSEALEPQYVMLCDDIANACDKLFAVGNEAER